METENRMTLDDIFPEQLKELNPILEEKAEAPANKNSKILFYLLSFTLMFVGIYYLTKVNQVQKTTKNKN